ncbi:MAG: nucleotidyltransferase domain-containing protein, partial [Mailhella sp.]|nr:nucleotidyltransferase domain-containing protein [Mailhella sp.]
MIGSAEKHELLEQASAMCAEKGARLLYLTVFGSALYGTGIAGKSDTDVRGVFLPGPESLILGTAPHSIHHTTGGGDSRNTGEDLDIDLWSVQHWLLKLLPAGDTGAEDVLFSPSNADCVLFRSPLLDAVFADPLRYLDTRNIEACVAYSLGQAKKYGIKGSRLGALRRVYSALCEAVRQAAERDAASVQDAGGRRNAASSDVNGCPAEEAAGNRLSGQQESGGRLLLSDCLQRLLDACPDERFCRMDTLRDEPMLFLCGKWHSPSITADEF